MAGWKKGDGPLLVNHDEDVAPPSWNGGGQQPVAAPAPFEGVERTQKRQQRSGGNSKSQAAPEQQMPIMMDPISQRQLIPQIAAIADEPDIRQSPADKEASAFTQLNSERDSWRAQLGLNGPSATRELSWDEYNALNAQQRAAVDANGALFQAVTADQADAANGAKDTSQDNAYGTAVEGLFGRGGGSDTYAPRTVAVLNELGLGKGGPSDLDNYLDLRGLVTDTDLGAITPENYTAFTTGQNKQPLDARQTNALDLSNRAITSLSQTLRAGQDLLGAARINQATPGSDILGAGTAAVGFNPGANPRDKALDDFFTAMARNDGFMTGDDVSQGFQYFQDNYGLDSTAVKNYMDTRLKAFDYETAAGKPVTLGSIPELSYLKPDEFRSLYYTQEAADGQ